MKKIVFAFFTCFLFLNIAYADYVGDHNAVRAEVMDISKYALIWDKTLENDAQKWADYLRNNYTEADKGASPHASHFDVGKHDLYVKGQGENIAWGNPAMSISKAIQLWAGEKSDYEISDNSCSGICGHYTQIVWQDTTHVGCARSISSHGYGEFVVCRYSPPGNYIGQIPYGDDGYTPLVDSQVTAANVLAQKGFIQDHRDDTAGYNLFFAITRKEMMKIVMNMSGVAVTDSCDGDFSDVENDWGCKYIETALDQGFIAHNTTFRPNDTVTKSEAMKLIFKARGVEKTQDTGNWQEDYMESAYSYDYIAEKYTDYNIPASRGWIFEAAARSYGDFTD